MWAAIFITMQIPYYRVKVLRVHLKRILEHAKCAPGDTRTANAIRLAKEDLRVLEKLLSNERRKISIP